MSVKILSSLTSKLANAHKIVETIVLRTNEGAVLTIEIGESVLSGTGNAIGAKITLLTNPPTHIGICEGETIEQVSIAAQELVANAILSGKVTATPQSSIPKPHISSGARVST